MKSHYRRWRRRAAVLMAAAAFGVASPSRAAAQVQFKPQDSPAPVITGFMGIAGSTEAGQRRVTPAIAPIILVPFGERFLFEGELELEGAYQSRSGESWTKEWEKAVEYAQLDWFVSRGLTVVAGRFLTPFGSYNERLHSRWIRNLPDQPIVAGMELTSSTGAMVRGGVPIAKRVDLSYSAFASAPSKRTGFEAAKATGGRGSLFFPIARVEVGGSFQRQFEDNGSRDNQYGLDMTWQANAVPLDVRGEYVRNAERGSGYWVEGAYRLRRVPFARALMRNSQVVFRAEQFFVSGNLEMAEPDAGSAEAVAAAKEGHGGALPDEDTRRFTAGWNYWITPGVRASVSFGRSLSTEANRNVWSFGLTYRFAAPVSGRSQ